MKIPIKTWCSLWIIRQPWQRKGWYDIHPIGSKGVSFYREEHPWAVPHWLENHENILISIQFVYLTVILWKKVNTFFCKMFMFEKDYFVVVRINKVFIVPFNNFQKQCVVGCPSQIITVSFSIYASILCYGARISDKDDGNHKKTSSWMDLLI